MVEITGHGLDPAVPDADERLAQVLAGEADRAQHGARARAIIALRQSRALPLQRRRAVGIRHGLSLPEARFYCPNRYDATTQREDDGIQMSASTTEAILPEAGLRAEIRLLGQLLGETLREHEGVALYELEESIRQRTKELRQRYDATEEGALVAELGRIPLDDAARLVRAFATYFQLVNLAELERQARSVAETTEDVGELDRSIARFAPQPIPPAPLPPTPAHIQARPALPPHP